jgi:hypothetical protein
MKKVIFGLALVAITLASYGTQGTKSAQNQDKHTISIKAMVSNYLQIKNGLANDNGIHWENRHFVIDHRTKENMERYYS